MILIDDVTQEYISKSNNLKGKIITQNGYEVLLHAVEIEVSKVFIELFGGNVLLLSETNRDKTMTPDFCWKDRLWEIKYPSTEQAVDSALRKGMKQIKDNPGGVVLYFGKKKIDLKKLKGIISSRMGKIRNVKKSVDIVIIYAEKEFKVLRYK